MYNVCSSLLAACLILPMTAVHGQDRLSGDAPASFTAHAFKVSNGKTLRYSLFVPKELPKDKRLPLVVYLHGAGGGTHAATMLAEAAPRGSAFPRGAWERGVSRCTGFAEI